MDETCPLYTGGKGGGGVLALGTSPVMTPSRKAVRSSPSGEPTPPVPPPLLLAGSMPRPALSRKLDAASLHAGRAASGGRTAAAPTLTPTTAQTVALTIAQTQAQAQAQAPVQARMHVESQKYAHAGPRGGRGADSTAGSVDLGARGCCKERDVSG